MKPKQPKPMQTQTDTETPEWAKWPEYWGKVKAAPAPETPPQDPWKSDVRLALEQEHADLLRQLDELLAACKLTQFSFEHERNHGEGYASALKMFLKASCQNSNRQRRKDTAMSTKADTHAHTHQFTVTATDDLGRDFGYCLICKCDMQNLNNGDGVKAYRSHKRAKGLDMSPDYVSIEMNL